ncbi:MAG: dihydrolipoyl dehydrogenase [Candidatus Sericytochromatia bacterium]
MQDIHTDVAVIGAGTAGLSAYRTARQQGARAVLIEGGAYGTTCARVGCMPSKLLIAAAEAAEAVREAPGFGVMATPAVIDGQAVMARVRSERDRFVGFVVEGVEEIPAADRLRGYARFEDLHTLLIDDHTRVHARSVVIATGSTPFIPPILAGLGDRLLVNDQVFEWTDLPRSVAVFGAGIIGLELGQALHRLGVRVHIFGARHAVGALSDPVLKEYAIKTFQAEFPFQPDARVERVERTEQGVTVFWLDDQDQEQRDDFEWVLAAAGRRPQLQNLGLEQLGLGLNRLGVPDFDRESLQVGDLPLFIAGDANNDLPLLHEAADEGKIAGANAASWPNVTPGKRRSSLSVMFTEPQMALVGQHFARLPAECTAIGQVSFENQGRSRVMRLNKGLLHIYAEQQTHRFLGAEMFGPRAEHMAHLLAWAHQQRLTIEQMLEMPFYHPVIEEGLRTALNDTLRALAAGESINCNGTEAVALSI